MKRHHIILTLALAGLASFQLKETLNLSDRTSQVREELELLRAAAERKAMPTASGKVSQPRKPSLEVDSFMADLTPLLEAPSDAAARENLMKFLASQEALLASAPTSKLKELCASLKAGFSPGSEGFQPAAKVWTGILGMVAKSDPDWAFGEFDEAATAAKAPMGEVLKIFARWAEQHGDTMSLSYASALRRWLDKAQSDGRIAGDSPDVARLRSEISTAEGDLSAALREVAGLPYSSQQEAAASHVEKLQTPSERRQALEEFSCIAHFQNFQVFASSLARKEGFEAAREILSQAALTPENHDLAAASMASAKIGPETRENAAWLWENLKSEDSRALEKFAENWGRGDHSAAATWLNSLPAGERRDAALKGFIPTIALIDGATAMDWALSISQPNLREWMYEEAYGKWKKSDPARAEAYRQANPPKAGQQPSGR